MKALLISLDAKSDIEQQTANLAPTCGAIEEDDGQEWPWLFPEALGADGQVRIEGIWFKPETDEKGRALRLHRVRATMTQ